MTSHSVLFIAYHYPPRGGAGVQRSVKFVKYLPLHGIRPLVLTSPPEGKNKWTPADASLAKDVGEANVVRVQSLPQPSRLQRRFTNLFGLPSPSGRAWARAALAAGGRMIEQQRPSLVYVSMSPFEGSAAASALSQKYRLPWVADLRDPWALDEMQLYSSGLHRRMERRRMRSSLASASAVIMNTPEAAARLVQEFPEFARKRVTCITNGYDAADFTDEPSLPEEHFTLVHSGFLHTTAGLEVRRKRKSFEKLGRIQPGVDFLTRSHFYLVQAIEKWLAESSEIRNRVRLRFIGSQTEADEAIVQNSTAKEIATFEGYLPHAESVKAIQSASLLFLPMHKLPSGQRATIVPGKTYEYMATGRPILAAVPEGDARDFVRAAGTGLVCEPDDVDGMLRILKRQFDQWKRGINTLSWNKDFVERFERKALTEKLADLLWSVAGHSPSPVFHSEV